jgi:transcriptional antiterminator NusG
MKWYAVQAFSGFEKSVQKGLEERIVRNGLQDQFGQILVPIEEVVEMKAGQKTISERKLYPGYVLVQMAMTDESWHLVKSTPRVTAFIGGSAQKPTPIRDKEVDIILQRIDDSKSNPTQKLTFEKGESIRIIDGPLITRRANCASQWLFLVGLPQLNWNSVRSKKKFKSSSKFINRGANYISVCTHLGVIAWQRKSSAT